MRFQFLPSSIEDGRATAKQHLICMVVDDCVAFDAGSLAVAASADQRNLVRDVVLSHAHLDHIAGLPLFIDDLFAVLEGPIRVHAIPEVIEVLERDVFNWSVYPKFSELANENGSVLSYHAFNPGGQFSVRHLAVSPIAVNHGVASCAFVISDGDKTIAFTGDTASTDEFWNVVNGLENLDVLIVECAFPDRLRDLASRSHHMTPSALALELDKFERADARILVGGIKPMYFDEVCGELSELGLGVEVVEAGKVYSV